MQLPLLQTTERFSEFEISRDVERDEMEPVHHVDGPPVRLLPQPTDQEIEMPLEDVLLRLEGPVREGVGEEPPHAGVIGVVGRKDGVGAVGPEAVPERVAAEVGISAVVSVDVVPSLWIDEGELVGRVADHGTIPVVQFFQIVDRGAAAERARAGDVGDDP